ncbi:sodium-dependent phosphate transporter, partial [Turicibacter sanguinis]|nr:sodium-dependent phosphate transporter [Turicibacter sanguinis]
VLYMIGCKSKPNLKNISEILIGFGILFIGMEFMKDAVAPLSQYEGFRSLLASLANHPLLALLAGFAMTTCLQSSSASMGILIALSSQGLMPLAGALPILYGDNIGSCTTSLISSVGANKNAKRAALMHLCFNVIGTMLFMIVLNKPISMIVTYLDPTDTARQIANSHTLFNIINVILLLPFSKYIVKLVMLLIPDKKDEEDEYDSRITKYLDERMLETPSIAFGNTIRETLRMGSKAKKSFTCSMNALLERSEDDAKTTFEKEKILNEQQRKVLDYLIKLSNRTLDDKMRFSLDLLFHTVNDIERVGDLSENIAELAEVAIQNKTKISDSAKSELIDIYSKVLDAYELSLDAMKQNNSTLANDVLKIEDEVDALDKLYRAKHMNRLNSHSCS